MVMKKKVGTKAKTGMMRTPKNQMLHIPQLAKKKTTYAISVTDYGLSLLTSFSSIVCNEINRSQRIL